jgi:hypothetical protein
MILAISIIALVGFLLLCLPLSGGNSDERMIALIAVIFILPILVISTWYQSVILGIIALIVGLVVLLLCIINDN